MAAALGKSTLKANLYGLRRRQGQGRCPGLACDLVEPQGIEPSTFALPNWPPRSREVRLGSVRGRMAASWHRPASSAVSPNFATGSDRPRSDCQPRTGLADADGTGRGGPSQPLVSLADAGQATGIFTRQAGLTTRLPSRGTGIAASPDFAVHNGVAGWVGGLNVGGQASVCAFRLIAKASMSGSIDSTRTIAVAHDRDPLERFAEVFRDDGHANGDSLQPTEPACPVAASGI